LIFTLTYQGVLYQTLDTQNTFQLTEAGDYSLVGNSKETATGLCSEVQSLTVPLSQSIVFKPILKKENCFGN
jgi:hypothetical protein